jgi:hypothetical protein
LLTVRVIDPCSPRRIRSAAAALTTSFASRTRTRAVEVAVNVTHACGARSPLLSATSLRRSAFSWRGDRAPSSQLRTAPSPLGAGGSVLAAVRPPGSRTRTWTSSTAAAPALRTSKV